jgi:hypothetical protein
MPMRADDFALSHGQRNISPQLDKIRSRYPGDFLIHSFRCVPRKSPMKLKSAYSTGEVARICCLSQTSIIRLFDSGVISGYRVPTSRFRRIPHEELVRFIQDHGLPNSFEATGEAPASLPGGDISIAT